MLSIGVTVLLGVEQAGEIDEQEFDVPSFCPEKPDPDEPGSNGGRFHRKMGGLARMRSLLPNAHYGAIVSFLLGSPPRQDPTSRHFEDLKLGDSTFGWATKGVLGELLSSKQKADWVPQRHGYR